MNIPEENQLYKTIDGERKLCISYSQLTTFIDCPRKWYYSYILGRRSHSKSEATSYGTCVHQTLEYFFKNGRRELSRQDLLDMFKTYVEKEDIPFSSLNSEAKAYIDAVKIINWICDIFERDNQGNFTKPSNLLSRAEYILRRSDVIGVEEDFVLKYDLPYPIVINGQVEKSIYFTGSLDLHVEKNNYHTIIDWKSDGKGYYKQEKLDTNLQHPIYSMYLYRKYKCLPGSCFYVHTRSQVCEEIKMDIGRVREACKDINAALSQMYSFASCYADKCKHDNPDFDEMELVKVAKPTPLCFWCDFSKTSGDSTCQFSSSYVKKIDAITKEEIIKTQLEIEEQRRIEEEKKQEEIREEKLRAEQWAIDHGIIPSQNVFDL